MELIDSTPDFWIHLSRRLRAFFRLRVPEEAECLTQETIALLLEQKQKGTQIEDFQKYAFGIARNLVATNWQLPVENVLPLVPEASGIEIRWECLNRCQKGLNRSDRKLLEIYFPADGKKRIANRKLLAKQLGVSQGALRVRVSRIISRIRPCVKECIQEKDV